MFRSFSKAWGLAGLRCGYALGGPGAEELLAQLEPELGLDELAQAGALESLRSAGELVARRAGELAAERDRLAGELRELGLDVPDSHSNFLWLAHPTLDGGEAAAALARAGIIVAPGGALGEPGHMRVTRARPGAVRAAARRPGGHTARPPDRSVGGGAAGLAQQRAGRLLEDPPPAPVPARARWRSA